MCVRSSSALSFLNWHFENDPEFSSSNHSALPSPCGVILTSSSFMPRPLSHSQFSAAPCAYVS